MENDKPIFKIACCTSENEYAGQTIEITFWKEETNMVFPFVTIATDECSMTLTIKDLQNLSVLLECAIGKWELLSNDKKLCAK